MLVTISGVSKSFGSETVLNNVNLRIENNARIGLIGLNGSGKSTLLQMIAGTTGAYDGTITAVSGITIGYLTQQLGLNDENTIYDEAKRAFEDVLTAERRLEEKRIQIEQCDDIKLLEKLNNDFYRMSESFEENKGYYYKSIVSSTLLGLGFDEEAQKNTIGKLSGGQKMRVALAKMLMLEPDLLMLDEPTNYLDMDGVIWLENYLCSYPKAYIVVSHDRYFLDKTVSTIWEADGTIKSYKGNYTAYLRQREDEIYAQNRAYEIQSAYIKKQREIIRKLKSYNREKSVKRARSREKQLAKLDYQQKVTEQKTSRISFDTQQTVSKNAFKFISLDVGYEGKALVENINFELLKGKKLGVCGRNATGKTTFLKTLYAQMPAIKGEIIYASGIKMSYFRQHHDDINRDSSIFDYLSDYSGQDITKVRSILGNLLFSKDEVNKNISVLSGGELSRVAVAKLMLTKSNVLLLDEPTNHLDIASKEVFEQAIRDYEGTAVIVSHDRYLLANVCDCIMYIYNNKAYYYELNYEQALTLFPTKEKSDQNEKSEISKSTISINTKPSMSKNEIKRSKDRVLKIEQLLGELENKKKQSEIIINSPDFYKDVQKSNDELKEYDRINEEYRHLEEEWLKLSYLLENNE